MRIALISDIHSNLEALEASLSKCRDENVDRVICLGDVVGYGADPNPCCEILREHTEVTLLGNHDAAVIGAMDSDYYYEAARHALFWTRNELTEENFRWLYSLPYTYRSANLGFFHSAPILPSGFYYVVSTSDAEKHIGVFNRLDEFNFCGHSHLTNAYLLTRDAAQDMTGETAKQVADSKWIINVGSVGQPRDRDNRACFGIFDTDAQTFEHFRIDYDIEATAEKILGAGLDEKFAKRLYVGM